MFDRKKILITGGTGSLGKALTKKFLETNVEVIKIFSRDEWKQVQMQSELNDNRLRFLIGDVRDKERLYRALEGIDIVIHAAALKQVPVAEYNPFEAVKTNVNGTQNLIDVCLDRDIEIAIGIGTDKSVSPLNTYGATKLLMERLFISANYYKGTRKIKFVCVRYGNVLGSRGSIVPVILDQIKQGKKITITDPTMTRFTITMPQAFDLIFRAIQNCVGGEVFIPKLDAFSVGDIKNAILELMKKDTEEERIPIRPGEKYHESLISKEELRNTFETDQDYIIFESQTQNFTYHIPKLRKTNLKDEFSSDKVKLLTKEELKDILVKEKIINL